MTKRELKTLQNLRRMLGMDGTFSAGVYETVTLRDSDEATTFIVERTKLWRETWILPVLDELIDKHKHRYKYA